MILTTYTNTEDGVESRIVRHQSGGFTVTLRDMDADEVVPTAKIFPDMERADAYARKVANVATVPAHPEAQRAL